MFHVPAGGFDRRDAKRFARVPEGRVNAGRIRSSETRTGAFRLPSRRLDDAAISHQEDLRDRLCRELATLWRRSKAQWVGHYAFSLANVRLELDTAQISATGHCRPITLQMNRDFPFDGQVPFDEFSDHLVRCFREAFGKCLAEVGRRVYA